MTEDLQFYKNMCLVPQVGYASRICTKWEKCETRKRKWEEQQQKMKDDAIRHESTFFSRSSADLLDEDEKSDNPDNNEFSFPENSGKYFFNSSMIDTNDDMPEHYRHIRYGLRSVRPEYYITMHKLKSEFHLSENQAQGAICTVENNLFNPKEFGEWKRYEKEKPTDYNTLPAPTNTNRTEPYIEALILSGIANEIMNSENSVVT